MITLCANAVLFDKITIFIINRYHSFLRKIKIKKNDDYRYILIYELHL